MDISQEVPLVLRRLVPSAYRPVLANRVFRRLILGFAVSYLADGMSFVAVAWLAIELAPQAIIARSKRALSSGRRKPPIRRPTPERRRRQSPRAISPKPRS